MNTATKTELMAQVRALRSDKGRLERQVEELKKEFQDEVVARWSKEAEVIAKSLHAELRNEFDRALRAAYRKILVEMQTADRLRDQLQEERKDLKDKLTFVLGEENIFFSLYDVSEPRRVGLAYHRGDSVEGDPHAVFFTFVDKEAARTCLHGMKRVLARMDALGIP